MTTQQTTIPAAPPATTAGQALPVAPVTPEIEKTANLTPNAFLLTQIKSMIPMNESGEIDFSSMDYSARIEAFMNFQENCNANLVMFQENVLTQLANGTTFVPMVVVPKADDLWDDTASKAIGCKPGETELKADFIISLGQKAGVTLKKAFEGPVELDGCTMYQVRYNAFVVQGDGVPLVVEEEGKDQNLYNKGGMQAHVVESTRKKAKRNAIAEALSIKKIMKREDAQRPWLILRPIFRDPAILEEQKRLGDSVKAQLYGAGSAVVDVDYKYADVSVLRDDLMGAETLEALEIVGKRVAASRLTGEERAELGAVFKQRRESFAPAAAPAQS